MSDLRVLSYNLRTAHAEDHPWPGRRQPMIAQLTALAPDLLGTQEGVRTSLRDLAAGLPERYAWVGASRSADVDDEQAAVAVNGERFAITDVVHRWLSTTPELPGSVGWDAALPRILTHVSLIERATGRRLELINTHLDHEGELARLRSAELIADRAAALIATGRSVVLTGDFNAAAGDAAPYAVLVAAGLVDAVRAAADPGPAWSTFTDYGSPVRGGKQIDWVFASPDLEPLVSRICLADDDPPPSDHLPVEVTFRLSG